MLNMTPYVVQTENPNPYQLAAVISHLGNPEKDHGHYVTFLGISGQWIRFNNTEVEAIEESAAFHENSPETEGSPQTATTLFYMTDN
jgi:ubiquitin C-terminal hydrolase